MSDKKARQEPDKQKNDEKEPLCPCMESQSDGAPCDCADSDCQTCGKGVKPEN